MSRRAWSSATIHRERVPAPHHSPARLGRAGTRQQSTQRCPRDGVATTCNPGAPLQCAIRAGGVYGPQRRGPQPPCVHQRHARSKLFLRVSPTADGAFNASRQVFSCGPGRGQRLGEPAARESLEHRRHEACARDQVHAPGKSVRYAGTECQAAEQNRRVVGVGLLEALYGQIGLPQCEVGTT
jgi:hypothetical protein